MNPAIRTSALALALLLAACGREEPAPAEPAAETSPAPAAEPAAPVEVAPVPAPVADSADAPLAAADLDLYVKGMTREIELLKGHADALAKARAAKDTSAETAAMLALSGVEVRDAGAAAAGIEVDRYVAIKEKIDDVLSALEMGVAMKPQIEAAEQADLSGFTEEQRKQHDERLPADIVETFKAREAELAKLRAEAIALRLGAIGG